MILLSRKRANGRQPNGANLGFEEKLWKAADKLRNNMDAAEYKHVVLGLVFLKYISDAFEERHAQLVKERESGADPEDKDEYLGSNVFCVPKENQRVRRRSSQNLPLDSRIHNPTLSHPPIHSRIPLQTSPNPVRPEPLKNLKLFAALSHADRLG